MTLPEQNRIIRTVKIKHPKGYLSSNQYTVELTEVAEEDRALEYLMNRLRLMTPIPKQEFEQRTGLHRETLTEGMAKAKQRGLLTESAEYWQLTHKGHMFVNDLLTQFC